MFLDQDKTKNLKGWDKSRPRPRRRRCLRFLGWLGGRASLSLTLLTGQLSSLTSQSFCFQQGEMDWCLWKSLWQSQERYHKWIFFTALTSLSHSSYRQMFLVLAWEQCFCRTSMERGNQSCFWAASFWTGRRGTQQWRSAWQWSGESISWGTTCLGVTSSLRQIIVLCSCWTGWRAPIPISPGGTSPWQPYDFTVQYKAGSRRLRCLVLENMVLEK